LEAERSRLGREQQLRREAERGRRRALWFMFVSGVLGGVAFIIAYFAYNQRQAAQDALDSALLATHDMVALLYDPLNNLMRFSLAELKPKFEKITESIQRIEATSEEIKFHPQLLTTKASLLNLNSDFHSRQGRNTEALSDSEEAAKLMEPLVNYEGKEKTNILLNIAESYNRISSHRFARKEYTGSLSASTRAINYFNDLVDREPSKAQWHRYLAINYISAANSAMVMNAIGITDSNAARGYIEEAMETSKRLLSLAGNVPEDKLIEADTYIAHALIKEGEHDGTPAWSVKYFDEVSSEFRNAVNINSQLVKDHPTILEMQINLIGSVSEFADFLVRHEKFSEASNVITPHIKTISTWFDKDDHHRLVYFAGFLSTAAEILKRYPRYDDIVIRSLKHATEIHKNRRESDPKHPQPCEDLAESIDQLASFYAMKFGQADKEWAQAERVWAECLQLINESLQRKLQPADQVTYLQRQLETANHVTYLQFKQGEVLSHVGKHEEALQKFQEGLKNFQGLAFVLPARDWRPILHVKAGDELQRLGRFNESLDQYRQELALQQESLAARPEDIKRLSDLAAAHRRIRDFMSEQNEFEGALTINRDAKAVTERLVSIEPNRWEWHLIYTEQWESELLAKLNKWDEAIAAERRALSRIENSAQARPGDIASGYNRLGSRLTEANQKQEALEAHLTAKKHLQQARLSDNRNDSNSLGQLAKTHIRIADLYGAFKDARAELEARKSAIDMLRKLAGLAREEQVQRFMADVAKEIGASGPNAPDEQAYQRILMRSREEMDVADEGKSKSGESDEAYWRHHLAVALGEQSKTLSKLNDLVAAEKSQRDAIEKLHELVERYPQDRNLQAELASAQRWLDDLLEQRRGSKGAVRP
jgi:hypothetical protein